MFDTKVAAARLSILSNTSLVLVKLTTGFITGSIGIISEAVHSGIDLLAAAMTYFSVKVSDRPPDREHPYGHGKIENITSIVEAVLILGAAVFILNEAIHKLRVGVTLTAIPLGIGVMIFSAGINGVVSRKLFHVARATDSAALEADAHHLSVDVYTSLGVLAGLGGVYVFGWSFLDPAIAIIIAFIIGKIAWDITRSSLDTIMDHSLPEGELETIRELILTDERIKGFHQLRTRKAGPHRHIDLHIQVDRDLTVDESHSISTRLEKSITKSLPRCRVVVHIEPAPEKQS